MHSHYLTTHSNLSTRIALEGLPAGMTALASIEGASYAESGGTILIAPLAVGRYELTIYSVMEGSVTALYRALLEVRDALPSPEVTEAGHLLTLTDVNALTVQVSPALVTIQQGSALPEWASCIEGGSTGISKIKVSSAFSMRSDVDNIELLGYGAGQVTIADARSVLLTNAVDVTGFGDAKLPEWTRAVTGDSTGITSIAIARSFHLFDSNRSAFPLSYNDGVVTMGSGVQVLRSLAQTTEGFGA